MPISRRTRRITPIAFVVGLAILGLVLLLLVTRLRLPVPAVGSADRAGAVAWPDTGQAAVSITGADDLATAGRERPVPIASVTKIMTALVVLERAPLRGDDDAGFTMIITDADVEDTDRRRARSESVVAVRAGDRISERQALLALLLPSANNLAHLLAVETAGSESAFVELMNARAASSGLRATTYADASGFDASTRSTARDQTVLAREAMRNPTFAWLVRQSRADLPTGPVVSTDRLLGRDGFVGVKTGSTTPAGGCFVFAARRYVGGQAVLVVGAVLGQRGDDPLRAAFDASERLVDSVSDTQPR